MDNTYFIGGSPCCGKSTIAERISKDYDAYYFKVDDFLDELIDMAAKKNYYACKKAINMTADETWMRIPVEQCKEEFLIYREIAEFVFEKLKKIKAETIIAEGTAFTPEVMEVLNPMHYMCMIPESEFQISHYKEREWIKYVLKDCTDKDKAFENWMQRDILFAKQIKDECEQKGIACVINDGSKSVDEVYELVKECLGLSEKIRSKRTICIPIQL